MHRSRKRSAAAFLVSPLASGITGTTLFVDKGLHSMGMPSHGSTPAPSAESEDPDD